MSTAAAIVMASLTMHLVGCGGDAGPSLFPATGTVKYKGEPVEGANITMLFDNGQNSIGISDAAGKFTLTTNGRPGAPAGQAKVLVAKTSAASVPGSSPDSMDVTKMMGGMGQAAAKSKTKPGVKEEIPGKYANPTTSGLTAEVSSSGANDFLFELQ